MPHSLYCVRKLGVGQSEFTIKTPYAHESNGFRIYSRVLLIDREMTLAQTLPSSLPDIVDNFYIILYGDTIAWKTVVFGINSMSGVRKISRDEAE